MRIVLTIHHFADSATGAPGATLALRDAYRAAGHEADVIAFDDMPAWIPARARELLFPWFCALRLAGRRDDVVDAASGDGWVWARLRRLLRRRTLLACRVHGLAHTFWDAELREAHESGRQLTRLSRAYHGGMRLREVAADLRGADLCLFLNAEDRERAVSELGVRADRTAIVANGIPAALLGLPAPAPPPSRVPLRLAHIGSYGARKGVRQLALALTALLAERPAVSVTLLGTRVPAATVLADYPHELHDRLHVVESYDRERLPELLAGHQVLVSASLAEGLSLALIEAMACGLVPVATDLPGVRAVVTDGRDAVLVPPRDADALRNALAALLDDPQRLQALREAAHATAQEYGWQRVAERQLELYAAALRA